MTVKHTISIVAASKTSPVNRFERSLDAFVDKAKAIPPRKPEYHKANISDLFILLLLDRQKFDIMHIGTTQTNLPTKQANIPATP
mmetsp:Transcript_84/g.134  ORF Transcript_84/g.134 Transcript_84/m.134 type:complete len:85 (+) Transcript_84:775-1029(+)